MYASKHFSLRTKGYVDQKGTWTKRWGEGKRILLPPPCPFITAPA